MPVRHRGSISARPPGLPRVPSRDALTVYFVGIQIGEHSRRNGVAVNGVQENSLAARVSSRRQDSNCVRGGNHVGRSRSGGRAAAHVAGGGDRAGRNRGRHSRRPGGHDARRHGHRVGDHHGRARPLPVSPDAPGDLPDGGGRGGLHDDRGRGRPGGPERAHVHRHRRRGRSGGRDGGRGGGRAAVAAEHGQCGAQHQPQPGAGPRPAPERPRRHAARAHPGGSDRPGRRAHRIHQRHARHLQQLHARRGQQSGHVHSDGRPVRGDTGQGELHRGDRHHDRERGRRRRPGGVADPVRHAFGKQLVRHRGVLLSPERGIQRHQLLQQGGRYRKGARAGPRVRIQRGRPHRQGQGVLLLQLRRRAGARFVVRRPARPDGSRAPGRFQLRQAGQRPDRHGEPVQRDGHHPRPGHPVTGRVDARLQRRQRGRRTEHGRVPGSTAPTTPNPGGWCSGETT